MSKRTQLLHKLKHVYSHNTKLVLDVENKDIELIIEGLEKQMGKKSKIYNDKYFDMFDCPNCKQTFDAWEGYSYCPECGQKLNLET